MENLESRGILSEAMKYKYENVEEMLTFMKNCAVKELNGEDLSYEETQRRQIGRASCRERV